MIPVTSVLTTEIEEISYPTLTFKIILGKNRISGYVDELEAVAQAIYLRLGTERYKFPIYSHDYGVQILDLFGKPMPYVISELERRITEALLSDDRISSVTNFVFEKEGLKLHVTFDVITDYGKIQTEKTLDLSTEGYSLLDGTMVYLNNYGTLSFNVPSFLSDDVLLFNDLPRVDEVGTLIFD